MNAFTSDDLGAECPPFLPNYRLCRRQTRAWQNPDIGEIQVIWLLAAQSLIIYVLVIYKLLLQKAHC